MNLHFWTGFLLLAGAAVEALFGIRLFVFARRRQQEVARQAAWFALWASVFSLASGVSYVLEGAHRPSTIFYRTTWTGWMTIGPGLHIALNLSGYPKLAKYVSRGLFVFWSVVLVVCLTTDVIEAGPVSLLPYVDRDGPLETPVRLFAMTQLVAVLISLIIAYRRNSGANRQRTAYFLLGTGLYAGLGGLAGALLPALGSSFNPMLAAFFAWPWVGLTFYSMTRHRLFDVRVVLSRIIMAVASTAIFGAIHVGVFVLLSSAVPALAAVIVAGLATALAVFGSPLLEAITAIAVTSLRHRTDNSRFFRDSAEALVAVLDINDLLRTVVQLSSRHLFVQQASFYVRTEAGSFERRFTLDAKPEAPTFSSTSPLLTWLDQHRDIFVADEADIRVSADQRDPIMHDVEKLEAGVIVPIAYKDQVKGFLSLGPRADRDAFVQRDIDLLTNLASQTAIAMENVRLYQEAITDGLTKLYHQKYFMEQLEKELGRARRRGGPLSVLFVDIDYFKSINDKFGHLVGNEVLKGLADLMLRQFRKEDVLARYGGEEFAVLLTDSPLESAIVVAERLRARVEAAQFSAGVRVTVSIGVGSLNLDGRQTALELVDLADAALYRAKNSGRNRVISGGVR